MANKTTRNAGGSGSIRKRPDGRWEARYTVGFDPITGKQIRKSVYGKTQKEVRMALTKISAEIDDGGYLEPTKMKTGAWLDTWTSDYICGNKPATQGAYKEHVKVHLKPYIGNVPLAKLAPQQIQALYRKLMTDKSLSPKTIKNIHGVIHKSLEQAKKLGYIKTNPADAVVLPRVEKKQVRTMDTPDLAEFLKAIQGDRYELELYVDVFTGLRQGELLGLTWDCVDFEHNMLLINKQHNRAKGEKEYKFGTLKNEQARLLTVPDVVMEALRKQQKRQALWKEIAGDLWDNSDNLVFTNEFGRYENNKTLYLNFKRIAASMGLKDMRFHDLRHTYAVNSLKAGDDIKTLQENLGHATASFTLSTYAHATRTMKTESANRMARFIESIQSDT